MSIRNKMHIERLLLSFCDWADYDSILYKNYFVFDDKERGGIITLMKTNGRWSIHRKGEEYCDPEETVLEGDAVKKLLWNHRAAVNRSIKALQEKKQMVLN
ncbi:hypothetical protein [Alkalihalobacterium elongatum]|uniref:hypothetical protein n=1 Tax=Alkalihalobacterium elongatum TaxID=2675466 RepID=UPI001C1F73D8|nr:hypothetical protein [Alkalihalobacterium elongatum]